MMRQNPDRSLMQRLVSKIVRYFKLELNDSDEWVYAPHQTTTNWHRDIVAAKCILYKGIRDKIHFDLTYLDLIYHSNFRPLSGVRKANSSEFMQTSTTHRGKHRQ